MAAGQKPVKAACSMFAPAKTVSQIQAGSAVSQHSAVMRRDRLVSARREGSPSSTMISLAFVGPRTPWAWLGLVPLLTGLVGYCPAYALFGIRTCKAR